MISSHLRIAGGLLVALAFSAGSALVLRQTNASEEDTAAVKQVVAAYDAAFNQHDAHAVGALFAEDGDFTNMRGSSKHGRSDIEQNYGNLFNGGLKASHRTDAVKSVRLLNPGMAQVDATWEMTGTKAADGSENPTRKGLLNWLVAKVDGQWRIVIFHESEFPK
ncbi:MAG TPA: SgcJ/EcaC family oxidoreductase [Candidatus Acidoferrales bacterium]|nr:SgcJ/EcaC family oxidoreductase [Candidatus Acidoferrales bacterium]